MTPDLPRLAALGIGPFSTTADALLAEAAAGIRAAAAEGAALVLLPELFAAPFYAADDPARWSGPAEPLDGPTCRWAGALAAETGASIVFGMALAAPGGGRSSNAALLAAPGAAPRVVQRKVHLAPAAGAPFGEGDHFEPGPPAIEPFDFAGMRLAALVCYDRRFPECWREAARRGADAVLVLVGGPADDPPGLYEAELRTHARANALYALAAARYGTETATGTPRRHDGATIAFGPDGAALEGDGRAARFRLDPARLAEARLTNPNHRTLRLQDPSPRKAYA